MKNILSSLALVLLVSGCATSPEATMTETNITFASLFTAADLYVTQPLCTDTEPTVLCADLGIVQKIHDAAFTAKAALDAANASQASSDISYAKTELAVFRALLNDHKIQVVIQNIGRTGGV